MSRLDPDRFLRAAFAAAIAAVHPARCLAGHLPLADLASSNGRVVVVGAGKAAAAMARTVEDLWDGPLDGLVVVPHGSRLASRRIEVVEAGHPVPDRAGEAAARRILAKVDGLGERDHVLCLISGGGSALLGLPAAGLDLADKQAINRALLAAGAGIAEINCVRKHLSAIKGGRLALACGGARVTTLAISDVPGDDASIIASGPTVPDSTTCADAVAVLRQYAIAVPDRVWRHLAATAVAETPKPGDPRFARFRFRLIASPRLALQAAADFSRAQGVIPIVIGDWIAGEARAAALALAMLARVFADGGRTRPRPCVLLSGGEAGVVVRGKGRGGRCTELLLAMALALDGAPGIWALAAGTDGLDGTGPHAGAVLGPDSLSRLRGLGADPLALLADNDSFAAFEGLGDLVTTGPTATNVSDFRAILVDASASGCPA